MLKEHVEDMASVGMQNLSPRVDATPQTVMIEKADYLIIHSVACAMWMAGLGNYCPMPISVSQESDDQYMAVSVTPYPHNLGLFKSMIESSRELYNQFSQNGEDPQQARNHLNTWLHLSVDQIKKDRLEAT